MPVSFGVFFVKNTLHFSFVGIFYFVKTLFKNSVHLRTHKVALNLKYECKYFTTLPTTRKFAVKFHVCSDSEHTYVVKTQGL